MKHSPFLGLACVVVWAAAMLMLALGFPSTAILEGWLAAMAACLYVMAPARGRRSRRPKEIGDNQWQRWAEATARDVDGSGLPWWDDMLPYQYLLDEQAVEAFEKGLDERCKLGEYARKEVPVDREIEQVRETIGALNRQADDWRSRQRAEATKQFMDAEQQARISGYRIKAWHLTPAQISALRIVWGIAPETILGYPVHSTERNG